MTVDDVKADAKVIADAGLELIQFMIDHGFSPVFHDEPRARWHKSKAARKKRRERLLRGEKG